MTGEQINERIDFLAGTVAARNLSINIRHLDEGLKIWMDILNNPAFPEDKLRREKDAALPGIRNRNKNVAQVAGNIEECKRGADNLLPNQPTIEAMAAKFGGRSINGLAKKYGDGTVHIVKLQ